jgi:hypothetical protein
MTIPRIAPYETHLTAAADALIHAGEAEASLRASLWAAYRRQRDARSRLAARIAALEPTAIRLHTLERRIPWLFLAVPAAFLLGLCVGGAM